MSTLAERVYFRLCLAFGRLLRAATYSTTRMVVRNGACVVRKYRRFYAPLLLAMGRLLVRILDTGVRVLPRRAWMEREQRLYACIHGAVITIDSDGALLLPCLPGRTLAELLDDPALEEPIRIRAIELAASALAAFHRSGFTHADAMAENVMVDIDPAVARWFDFETLHEERRPLAWRRADDVRALLVTCLLRTAPAQRAEVMRIIVRVCADDEVRRLLTASFARVIRRPLTFHLAQAGLSLECYREIGRLLGR